MEARSLSDIQAAYAALLHALALDVGIDPAGLLETEEIEVNGHGIGLRISTAAADGAGVADADMPCFGDVEMFCTLGHVDVQRDSDALGALLQGAYLGVATGGAAFAIDERGCVLLWISLPLERLSAVSMPALLAGFATIASFWRGRLNGTEHAPRAPALPALLRMTV